MPQWRYQGEIDGLKEAERHSWHFVCQLQGGENFVGIHVVVGVALEPEGQPVVEYVLFAVP